MVPRSNVSCTLGFILPDHYCGGISDNENPPEIVPLQCIYRFLDYRAIFSG